MHPKTTRATLLVGMTLAIGSTPASAADAGAVPAAAVTRTSAAIIADHIAALGGAKTLKRHRSVRLLRRVTVKGMGIEGTEERFATSANKFLSRTTIPGVGTVRQGSDGKIFWSDDPINGTRLLSGVEKEQAMRDARWNAELNLANLYDRIVVVAPPANAPTDVALECLELVSAKVPTITACFDKTTHHRVFQTGRQSTPQGEIPFEARFSEWRIHGGVSLPMVEETKAGPTTIVATVSEVKFNEAIDSALFKLKLPPATTQTTSAPPAKP